MTDVPHAPGLVFTTSLVAGLPLLPLPPVRRLTIMVCNTAMVGREQCLQDCKKNGHNVIIHCSNPLYLQAILFTSHHHTPVVSRTSLLRETRTYVLRTAHPNHLGKCIKFEHFRRLDGRSSSASRLLAVAHSKVHTSYIVRS